MKKAVSTTVIVVALLIGTVSAHTEERFAVLDFVLQYSDPIYENERTTH